MTEVTVHLIQSLHLSISCEREKSVFLKPPTTDWNSYKPHWCLHGLAHFPAPASAGYNTHQQKSHLLPPDTTWPQRGETKTGEHLWKHKVVGVFESWGSQTFQLQMLLEHLTEQRAEECWWLFHGREQPPEHTAHLGNSGGVPGRLLLSRLPTELPQPCRGDWWLWCPPGQVWDHRPGEEAP